MKINKYLIISIILLTTTFTFSQTPTTANEWIKLASKQYSEKNYKAAIESAGEAIKLDKRNAVAYLIRGLSRNATRDYLNSIDDFLKVNFTTKDPELLFSANYNGGLAANRGGDYSAITMFTKANKINPKHEKTTFIYYERGFAYYLERKPEEAIADFTRAINLSPEFRQAYYWRARINCEFGKEDLAAQDEAVILKLGFAVTDPCKHYSKLTSTVNALAEEMKEDEKRVYRDIFSEESMKQGLFYYYYGQHDAAKKEFGRCINWTEALRRKSNGLLDKWNCYRYRGIAKYAAKDYESSFADLQKAQEIVGEKDYKVLELMGNIRYIQSFGQKDKPKISKELSEQYLREAVGYLEKSISLEQSYSQNYAMRSLVYCRQGKKELAAKDEVQYIKLGGKLEKPCSSAPTNTTASTQSPQTNIEGWLKLGAKQMHEENFDAAVKTFSECIKNNPKAGDCYFLRSKNYFYLKKYKQALYDLNKVIEISPKYYWAYADRSMIYSSLKGYLFAREDADKAIELNPKDSIGYFRRGIANQGLKNYHEAVADFSNSIQADPKSASAYYQRGITYIRWQKRDLGIKDLSKAIELNPIDLLSYQTRALNYCALGKVAKAKADEKKLVELGQTVLAPCGEKNSNGIVTKPSKTKATDKDYPAIQKDPKTIFNYSNWKNVFETLAAIDIPDKPDSSGFRKIPDLLFKFGDEALRLKKYDEATKVGTKLFDIKGISNDDKARALLISGHGYTGKKNYFMAKMSYNLIKFLNPSSFYANNATYWLGNSEFNLKNYAKAIVQYKLLPNHYDSQINILKIYILQKNYAEIPKQVGIVSGIIKKTPRPKDKATLDRLNKRNLDFYRSSVQQALQYEKADETKPTALGIYKVLITLLPPNHPDKPRMQTRINLLEKK